MILALFRFGIRMVLGLLDPEFICTDQAPDPSINKQKNEENPLPLLRFVTSLLLLIFEE
jgi:hypothetical protein